MSFEMRPANFDVALRETVYLKRRVREEADAAASAGSLAAMLIHVALAIAYAERCGQAGDRAWVANHRLW